MVENEEAAAEKANDGEFARRLRLLFDNVHNPEPGALPGDRYTFAAAAKEINRRAELSGKSSRAVTSGYLHQLASGERANPTLHRVEGIADLFGVDVAYFVQKSPSWAWIQAQAEVAAIKSRPHILELAARIEGLSPRNLQAIMAVIDNLRRYEGLPPVPGD